LRNAATDIFVDKTTLKTNEEKLNILLQKKVKVKVKVKIKLSPVTDRGGP
jgi:hypothetical protein